MDYRFGGLENNITKVDDKKKKNGKVYAIRGERAFLVGGDSISPPLPLTSSLIQSPRYVIKTKTTTFVGTGRMTPMTGGGWVEEHSIPPMTENDM